MNIDAELFGEAVKQLVHTQGRLGLTWRLRPATVAINPTIPYTANTLATYDGDTSPIRMISLVGPIQNGARVMAVYVPPQGNYIIGFAGTSKLPALGVVSNVATTSSNGTITSSTTETHDVVTGDVTFNSLGPGRRYRVVYAGVIINTSSSTIPNLRLRYAKDAPPTSSSDLIISWPKVTTAGGPGQESIIAAYTFTVPSPGMYYVGTFLQVGTGTAQALGQRELYVEDVGPA